VPVSSQYTWKPRSAVDDHIADFKAYMAAEYGIDVKIAPHAHGAPYSDFDLGPWPARIHRSGWVKVFEDTTRKDGSRMVWQCKQKGKKPNPELEASREQCKCRLEELLTQDG